jgi:hypothetical protein
MSANSIEQISLRSLDRSARSSRSHIHSTDTLSVESDFVRGSSPVAEPRDFDDPVPLGSSGGYIDGGYGWVVTAGMYSRHIPDSLARRLYSPVLAARYAVRLGCIPG